MWAATAGPPRQGERALESVRGISNLPHHASLENGLGPGFGRGGRAREARGAGPGPSEWVHEAVAQLRRRRDQLVRDNSPARQIALRIGRTLPLVWGGGDLGEVAAMRWRNQVNENAKAPAFCGALPELTHNEICG